MLVAAGQALVVAEWPQRLLHVSENSLGNSLRGRALICLGRVDHDSWVGSTLFLIRLLVMLLHCSRDRMRIAISPFGFGRTVWRWVDEVGTIRKTYETE